MSSVNVELEYFEHPKTTRLVDLLGRGAEVLPLKLWIYCGKFHARDGRLTGYSAQEIESRLGWWGKPGAAIKALVDCGKHIEKSGFLDPIPRDHGGGFSCHDWSEHNGHIVIFQEKAKKAAQIRWEKQKSKIDKPQQVRAKRDAPSIAPSIASSNALAKQCDANPLTPFASSNASSIEEKEKILDPDNVRIVKELLGNKAKDHFRNILGDFFVEHEVDQALGRT